MVVPVTGVLGVSFALAVLPGVFPVRTAETIPSGMSALHLSGGFLFVGIPSFPVPILSGDAELGFGIADGIDLRVRYTSHLGIIHRLGVESRCRIAEIDGFTMAIRLHPSGQFAGAAQEGIDFGGDVSTGAGLVATVRTLFGAITVELGGTIEWLLYENIAGVSFVDTDPRFDGIDLALEYEHPLHSDANITVRLEARIPSAPGDPFTVLGVEPRILVGSSFSI
jgi:hypothetical protein